MLKELLRSRGGALFRICRKLRRGTGFAPQGDLLSARAESRQRHVQGRKYGFDFEREGRVLAHSIFPLKPPEGYGGAFRKCGVLSPARGNRMLKAAVYRCRSNGGRYSQPGRRSAPAWCCAADAAALMSGCIASHRQTSGSGNRTAASYRRGFFHQWQKSKRF